MEFLQVIITGIFSLSVALGSVWLKHYLDTRKKLIEDANYEGISNSDIDNMVDIQNFLDAFREKWKFDRIGIFQFHNGGKFFHGVPMKKYSQSFESISAGISRVKEKNQGVLVTEHPSLMKSLSEKDFCEIEANNPILDYMRDRVKEEGVLQIFSAPIRSLSGQLIGFVSVQTVKNKIRVTKDLELELEELVNNISGYLLYKKK
jgi:hypothetical protein